MNECISILVRSIKCLAKINGFIEVYRTSFEDTARTVHIPNHLKAVRYISKDMNDAYNLADGDYDYSIKFKGRFILYEVKEQLIGKRKGIFFSNYFLEYHKVALSKKRAIEYARKRFPEIFDPKDKVLHIPIGCAGSGKSTLSKSFSNTTIISPDINRIEMLDSLNTHIYYQESIEPMVWNKAYADLETAMRNQQDIYFDATNLTVLRRSILIDLAEKYRYRTELHVMQTSLAECITRNSKRDKKVPVNMVIRQFKSRELPLESEILSGEMK